MSTETVEIRSQTHAKLKQLAAEAEESLSDVLDKAVEALARQRFLEGVNRAFAELRGNAAAWAEELEERRAWDAASDERWEEA